MTPAESGLLTSILEEVKGLRTDVTRFDRENIVLRSDVRRIKKDVGDIDKLVTAHEKKINYAMGGSVVVGFLIGFMTKYWEKVRAVLG